MALGKIRSRKSLKKIKSILVSDDSSNVEDPTGLPVVFYAVRALEQIALETKGPIMVGGEKKKKARQKTIDAWVTWINNELGIEPKNRETDKGGENQGENGDNATEDAEDSKENDGSGSEK